MENNNNTLKKESLFIPIMSIAIFLMLVFSAGYAYFSLSASVQTANGNVVTPGRPTLTCTKTDGSVTVAIANMIKTQNSTVAGSAAPKLTCGCTGSGKCTFTVNTNVTFPTGVTALSAANEVTIAVTSNNSTYCANVATKNYANGALISCTVPASKTVLLTANVSFWNLNTVDQSNTATTNNKAGKTLVFNLSVPTYSFTA